MLHMLLGGAMGVLCIVYDRKLGIRGLPSLDFG